MCKYINLDYFRFLHPFFFIYKAFKLTSYLEYPLFKGFRVSQYLHNVQLYHRFVKQLIKIFILRL